VNKTTTVAVDEATASDRTIYSLLSAAHALEAKVESTLGEVGLSMPKFSVLSALVAASNPLSLSELASKLSCVRSNMTQLVDRLEADGLVKRVSCPEDRRSVKAEITSLGRERQAAGQTAFDRLNGDFSAAIGQAERDALAKMLDALQ
jgi:DNA-binding MarR family transcriptional regulator